MYNRYIPQPDGSFQRSRVQSQNQQHPPRPSKPSPPPPEMPCPPPEPERCPPVHHPRPGNFLRNLLPRDFDTGDLIVLLLLLLMAGDCEEDRNNALLTIAMYFMM